MNKLNSPYLVKSVLIFFLFFSFLFGLLEGVAKSPKEERCIYKSLLSVVNIPYNIGCELTKPRFD